MATQRRRKNPLPFRRQRYRLRSAVKVTALRVCPEWLDPAGVYEGDIDPSTQDFHQLRIRLICPDDPERSYLVDETILEEVD